jgi:hypothetical protein
MGFWTVPHGACRGGRINIGYVLHEHSAAWVYIYIEYVGDLIYEDTVESREYDPRVI